MVGIDAKDVSVQYGSSLSMYTLCTITSYFGGPDICISTIDKYSVLYHSV